MSDGKKGSNRFFEIIGDGIADLLGEILEAIIKHLF